MTGRERFWKADRGLHHFFTTKTACRKNYAAGCNLLKKSEQRDAYKK
jgi:hypothetical protein